MDNNLTRHSAKLSIANQSVSPVVSAFRCIRHFSVLCDGWYHAEDIVTIIDRIFTLPRGLIQQLTPEMMKQEVENDPETMSVAAIYLNGSGIHRRDCRRRSLGETYISYYYCICSMHGGLPPVTSSGQLTHEAQMSALQIDSADYTWPQDREHFLQET